MNPLVVLALGWLERTAPVPAGAAGLGVALLTIAVLAVWQVRGSWLEHTSPGPVPRQSPVEEREARALYWPVAIVLIGVVAVVVVERFVVMT